MVEVVVERLKEVMMVEVVEVVEVIEVVGVVELHLWLGHLLQPLFPL
jgi:hypothetical protein